MIARPPLVVHGDWSAAPGKRWMARAIRQSDGTYLLHAPEPAGDPVTWLGRLRAAAGGGGVFLGVDFPIGLPAAYARRMGVADFPTLLPQLGAAAWADFYRPAESADQIALHRPFYPARPGSARRQHLLDGLGMAAFDDLLRTCDRATSTRRAAAPLFWTMGAQQVGKAAISGWRDVLAPALRQRGNVTLWPFAGPLEALLGRSGIVVAESYPAEFYAHLGLAFPKGPDGRGGKRSAPSRAANAAPLFAWAGANPVRLTAGLTAAIGDGFGAATGGEDGFDAVVGLVGMLNVLFGRRPAGEPQDEATRRVEGWILGQKAGG